MLIYEGAKIGGAQRYSRRRICQWDEKVSKKEEFRSVRIENILYATLNTRNHVRTHERYKG